MLVPSGVGAGPLVAAVLDALGPWVDDLSLADPSIEEIVGRFYGPKP